jgi:NhaP-type Na+/H+ and K+/H+ antiporter
VATAALEGGEQPREVVQFVIAADAPATRRARDDLEWPSAVRLVEVERDGQRCDPGELRAGDVVTLITATDTIGDLEELFGPAPASGELVLSAAATLGDLQDYYGVAVPAGLPREMTLADYAARQLRGRSAAGDVVAIGDLQLRVREARAGVVRSLSLRLTTAP